MNRMYLFRGKRISDNNWIEGSLIQWPTGAAEIAVYGAKPGSLVKYAVHPKTIGMQSPIPDKKGKLIWEGDIIHHRYKDQSEDSGWGELFHEVRFVDGAFCWIGEVTGQAHPFLTEPLPNYEVAGTIHDNPELIQKLQS